MKQYNRIMLGEHGKYLQKCLDGKYIGTDFLKDVDLSTTDTSDEIAWRKQMIDKYRIEAWGRLATLSVSYGL